MRILDRLRQPSVALDVGTAMTRGCSDVSEVAEIPSVLPDEIAAGVRRGALRGGVVCDVAAAAEIIALILHEVGPHWRRPAALVCAPTDATQSERDFLTEAVVAGGASVTAIVPEPLAAAIGAGLDVSSEYAQFVVDIGEGVTDVAVIRNGQIAKSAARRTGCSDIRRSLVDWLRWHRSIIVGDAAADDLIRAFCCGGDIANTYDIAGRSTAGEISACSISRDDIGALVEPVLDSISEFILHTFLRLPDRLAVEVIESGALLTGGGAVLDTLVQRIESATGLSVARAANPLRSVIIGARKILGGGPFSTAA